MSNVITKYCNTPTHELVAGLHDKRQYSPLIEELCQRLEASNMLDDVQGGMQTSVECPVCEATMFVKDEGTRYELSFTEE